MIAFLYITTKKDGENRIVITCRQNKLVRYNAGLILLYVLMKMGLCVPVKNI